MSLQEFENEKLSERDRGYLRMRSIMDYGMGILWAGMGLFMIFIKYFDTGLEARFGDGALKAFGGICVIYGIFRIYRGYKKNYYRPE